MAKPIKATPDLVGEEANKFLKKMLAVEKSKITLKDKELVKRVVDVSRRLKIKTKEQGMKKGCEMCFYMKSICPFHEGFQQGKVEGYKEVEKMIDEMQTRIRIHSDARGDLDELKSKLKQEE